MLIADVDRFLLLHTGEHQFSSQQSQCRGCTTQLPSYPVLTTITVLTKDRFITKHWPVWSFRVVAVCDLYVCVCIIHGFLLFHLLREVSCLREILSRKPHTHSTEDAAPNWAHWHQSWGRLMSWIQTPDATCKYQTFQPRFRDWTYFSLRHF